MSNTVLMIGGCGSSGSTLLSHIIDSHDELYCGPELYLLNKRLLYEDFGRLDDSDFEKALDNGLPTTNYYGENILPFNILSPTVQSAFLYRPDRHNLSDERIRRVFSDSNNFHQFAQGIFDALLSQHEKRIFLEKTPTNCYCIPHFLNTFPNGKYIHIVRDGRDVIPSLVGRGMRVHEAVRRWMFDTSSVIPYRDQKRCYILKYEDLVFNTESELERLLSYVGVDSAVERTLSKAFSGPHRGNRHSSWKNSPDEGISTSSVKKWKGQAHPIKSLTKKLFHSLSLSPDLCSFLGTTYPLNGLGLLSEFGYRDFDGWETSSSINLRYTGLKVRKHILSTLTTKYDYFVYQ
jgi:hypothetical protein